MPKALGNICDDVCTTSIKHLALSLKVYLLTNISPNIHEHIKTHKAPTKQLPNKHGLLTTACVILTDS